MKKKLLKMLLGSALVMGLAACGGGNDEAGGDTAAAGDAEKIYSQKCSSCHGGDLKGGMGPELTAVGASKSKDEIAAIIKDGTNGGMPAGLIEGDDLDKVAEWLAAKK
ncbi:cytochrome c551 [Neobacillus sp. DY30]|uniref:cytochrome c551 n=1 Tax=Neobacillus sp. DY30 TaxID=3047871 RepID=UPI0024BF13B1|nr:cytochrome c [Neobacillus sp. DY30]WHX99967.1 cytochrome c [Neobacillus sp. DY30]